MLIGDSQSAPELPRSKCACREEASLAGRFPVLLVNSGRDDIAYDATGPGHGAEPTASMFRNWRRNNLREGLTEAGNQNRLLCLPESFKEGKAGGFEFGG